MAAVLDNRTQELVIVYGPPGEEQRIALRLNEGLRYRAVVSNPLRKSELLERIAALGVSGAVAGDGGLISNLKIWENMVLPLAYHGKPSYSDLEQRAALIFRELGYSRERFEALCGGPPDRLTRLERRTVAFVRAMLGEPELMVYDNLFEGLAREDTDRVLQFDRVFARHFPFRTALYLDLDLPLLPDVPVQTTFRLP